MGKAFSIYYRAVILRGAGWPELWVNAVVLWAMAILLITMSVIRFLQQPKSWRTPSEKIHS